MVAATGSVHLLATPSNTVSVRQQAGPAHVLFFFVMHMQAWNPLTPCPLGLLQGVLPCPHLSDGTVLEKKGMPLSWGLLEAGLIRGTCAVAATPAAATVAPEQMSPMTATAGQHTPDAGGRTYRGQG